MEYFCVATMNTDADDGGANAKPPLICAPCWICLEEGPDEAGEPLVRDCACRGETSAGYHLSCIVQYNMVRLDEVIKACEKNTSAYSIVQRNGTTQDFEFVLASRQQKLAYLRDENKGLKSAIKLCNCPNCLTPYHSSIQLSVLEAAEKRTTHLSDFHCVRYHILLSIARARKGADVTREVYEETKTRLQGLLAAVEDNPTDLALARCEQTSGIFFVTDWDLVREKSAEIRIEISQILASINQKLELRIDAMRNLQEALDTLDTAEAEFGYENRKGKTDIMHDFNNLNRSLGSRPTVEDVAAIRQKLDQEIAREQDIAGDGKYTSLYCGPRSSVCSRIKLAVALMGVDPPEFIEAIKLMQEVVTELDRIYGHAHRSTSLAKNTLESIKERFRKSLEEMRVENESRETMDINKRPKQQEKRDCVQAQQRIAKD